MFVKNDKSEKGTVVSWVTCVAKPRFLFQQQGRLLKKYEYHIIGLLHLTTYIDDVTILF